MTHLPSPQSTAQRRDTLPLVNLKWEHRFSNCQLRYVKAASPRAQALPTPAARAGHVRGLALLVLTRDLLVPPRACFQLTCRLIRNTRINCWLHRFWIQCPSPFRSLNTLECNRCCSLELDVNLLCSVHRLL